jgi:hypothetical protein
LPGVHTPSKVGSNSGFIEKILYGADVSEFQVLAPPAPATQRQAAVKRTEEDEEDEEEVVVVVKEEEETTASCRRHLLSGRRFGMRSKSLRAW